MSFDEDLGARLRMLRQKKRISQECLGQWLGVTFQQIQKYESGATRMPPEKINRAAGYLNVPVGYFFGQETPLQQTNFDGRVMTIANAVAALPSEELTHWVYNMVLSLNDNIRLHHHIRAV